MEETAANTIQRTRHSIRSLFHGSDLSIRTRLIACFVSIVLLMMVADGVAVWQFRESVDLAEHLSAADEVSHAIVRVHLNVDRYRNSIGALGGSREARQFSMEADSIRRTFVRDVDQAQQALRAAPDIEKTELVSSALKSLRGTLLSQLDTAVQLANAAEWDAVRLRMENDIPVLIEFSSSLVERVEQEVLEQRTRAIEDTQRARSRLLIIVPIAALLTLLGAAALGWYVTQTITAPLSELTACSEALADGNFQKRVEVHGEDELAVLGRAFNDAAGQLQQLYADLHRNEQELRDVINTVPAHVWRTSPEGAVDFINERLQKFLRLPPDDLLGWNWESVLHPDDCARFLDHWRASLKHGQSMESEVRVRGADGQYCWFSIRNVPLRDAAGKVIKSYGSGIEIHDRKRAEEERDRLRQLEADLAHLNRVSMMGELAASLAHEIKQPITAASINAAVCMQWLRRSTPGIAEASEAASRVASDVKRAADIIDRVRSLYQREMVQRKPVDVNEIVREMITLLRDAAHRNSVSIRTDLDAGLPMIPADRVQLQQVLMNLMLNSIDAMKDTRGELAVTSGRFARDHIIVAVTDSGCGLPVDGSERLFDAFFTTKPHGTGMGLSISRRIIESHGGRLWAANTGRGATFQFTLPVPAEASLS